MLYVRGPVCTHAEFAVIILPSYSDPYWRNVDLGTGFLVFSVKVELIGGSKSLRHFSPHPSKKPNIPSTTIYLYNFLILATI